MYSAWKVEASKLQANKLLANNKLLAISQLSLPRFTTDWLKCSHFNAHLLADPTKSVLCQSHIMQIRGSKQCQLSLIGSVVVLQRKFKMFANYDQICTELFKKILLLSYQQINKAHYKEIISKSLLNIIYLSWRCRVSFCRLLYSSK